MQSSFSLSLTKSVRLHGIEYLLPRTSSPVVFVLPLIVAFLCECFSLTQLVVKKQPTSFSHVLLSFSSIFLQLPHLNSKFIVARQVPSLKLLMLLFFLSWLEREGRFACEVREQSCCYIEVSGGLAEISQGCFALLLLGKIYFWSILWNLG